LKDPAKGFKILKWRQDRNSTLWSDEVSKNSRGTSNHTRHLQKFQIRPRQQLLFIMAIPNLGQMDSITDFAQMHKPRAHRGNSQSRRVVRRYQQAVRLIDLASQILFSLLSLYMGSPVSDFDLQIPNQINSFFKYAIANSNNVDFEKRTHAFVISCARRFLARTCSIPLHDGVRGFDAGVINDVFKQFSLSGSNLCLVILCLYLHL
jgi:hypothetical protein